MFWEEPTENIPTVDYYSQNMLKLGEGSVFAGTIMSF